MKKIIAALLLLMPVAAWAQDAPKTLLMPTPLMATVEKYLAQRPYSEVAALMSEIDGCASAQIPHNGVVMDHGQCPAVTQALAQKAPLPARQKAK